MVVPPTCGIELLHHSMRRLRETLDLERIRVNPEMESSEYLLHMRACQEKLRYLSQMRDLFAFARRM